MKLNVTSVDQGVPSVSPDYLLFQVDVTISDVWCEEEKGLRKWVARTFASPPQVDYWAEGRGKGSLTFTAHRVPAMSREGAREAVASLHPLDLVPA